METVWVLGDQLNRNLGALVGAHAKNVRVLMVESAAKLGSKRWHVQRAHLVITAMRRFAEELRAEGFAVDYRRAPSLTHGLRAHNEEHAPSRVVAMEPASWDGLALLAGLGVEVVASNQFLCHRADFAAWAATRKSVKMEDFYRWQLTSSWHLAHTLLSPYLNLGLLLPGEVCDAADTAYRSGAVPIASAEGFIRQIIGWREYVWGRYWQWMPEYRDQNELGAHRPLPPLFAGAPTSMRCVSHVLRDVEAHGWTHHIQRLMVLGNLALLAGVEPLAVNDWMWSGFVDGAEWVMLPNVIGMALHADGGRMETWRPFGSVRSRCSGCSIGGSSDVAGVASCGAGACDRGVKGFRSCSPTRRSTTCPPIAASCASATFETRRIGPHRRPVACITWPC